MATRIQVRRDTLANFLSANVILADGEPAHLTDLGADVVGDGSSKVDQLRRNITLDPATNLLPASVMGALGALYRARDEAVRVTIANMPTWNRKRRLAALGQAPARILCVGDSTTAGVYSDSYTTAAGTGNQGGPNAYPARLAAYLTARGIPAAVGMAIPGHAGGNSDSRWSGSAGQNYAGAPIGMGGNAGLTMTASGQQIILTPGVKADKFIVYYYADTGTGTMTAQGTGGSAGTISTVGSGPSVGKATVTAGAPSISNTLTLSWASGTVFILGVEFYDSTNPNIVRVLPAGVGGSRAQDWNQTQGFGSLVMIQAIAPDLTIISLGINDDAAGRTPAQILADVNVVINNAAKLSGDVLLMSAFPHPSNTTLDQVNDAYYATTYPYVDLAWRYGHNMLAWGFMTSDQTHPNALGYDDAASVLARVI
jgi:lysophospholipase L1-like esterase